MSTTALLDSLEQQLDSTEALIDEAEDTIAVLERRHRNDQALLERAKRNIEQARLQIDGTIPTTEGAQMSTMTADYVTSAPAAVQANGAAFEAALERRDQQQSFLNRVQRAPRRLRDWLLSQTEGARNSDAGQKIGRGFSKMKGLAVRISGPFRVIGWFGIAGGLLTCQGGRDLIRKAAEVSYTVISFIPRKACGLIASVLNRFSWGRKFTAWVSKKVEMVETWVYNKLDAGLSWFDEREHARGMSAARVFFQTGIASRLVGHYVPEKARPVAHLGALFVPLVGVGPKHEIETKWDALGMKVRGPKVESAGILEMPSGTPDSEVMGQKINEAIVLEIVKATTKDGKEVDVQKFTDKDGEVWVKWDGTMYAVTDLPDDLTFKPGVLDSNKTVAKVAAAAGAESPLPRAARRERPGRQHGPAPARS